VEVANPEFNKGIVHTHFLVLGLVDYLLCKNGKNVNPTNFSGNTVCLVEILG
jgi:hypothetical protein